MAKSKESGLLGLLRILLSWPVIMLVIVLMFKKEILKLFEAQTNRLNSIPNILPAESRHQDKRTPDHKCPEISAQDHQVLAQAYTLKGALDEAISQYKSAILKDEENASAYIGLGNSYHKKGMYKEAIQCLEKAVEKKPYWADARCNLAAAYSLENQHNKAIEEFLEAIKINNNYSNAHFGLGVAYISANKLDKALEQVEILKELEPFYAEKLEQSVEEIRQKLSTTTVKDR